jgi:putative membrane protein insertion efficiency factor
LLLSLTIDHRPSTLAPFERSEGNLSMKRALLLMIRLYQRLVSPLLPPACRYVPTCSEYAMEAVEWHGLLKGVALATWRLVRCHPFARGGYDPVPHAHAEPAVKRHEVASGLTPGA